MSDGCRLRTVRIAGILCLGMVYLYLCMYMYMTGLACTTQSCLTGMFDLVFCAVYVV